MQPIYIPPIEYMKSMQLAKYPLVRDYVYRGNSSYWDPVKEERLLRIYPDRLCYNYMGPDLEGDYKLLLAPKNDGHDYIYLPGELFIHQSPYGIHRTL